MRVAIIDDDEIGRRNLKDLLADYGDIEIAGEASTLGSAVALTDREKPDAVFLSVHVGRQQGFRVLEQSGHQPLVIVTATHPHFAVKAFEVGAVDYLLKPVVETTLANTLQRLVRRIVPARPPAALRLDPV